MKKQIIDKAKNIGHWSVNHKKISGAIMLATAILTYWSFGKMTGASTEARYVVDLAKKDSIVVSINASGQVSTSNQVDIKSNVSGDVLRVMVQNGEKVKSGDLLVQLDDHDARKSVRDAEIGFASAEISLQKLIAPADALALMQGQNNLDRANENLSKSYDAGFTSLTDNFSDMSSLMTDLKDIIYGDTVGGFGQDNSVGYKNMADPYDNVTAGKLRGDVISKYKLASDQFDKNYNNYQSSTRLDSNDRIKQLVSESYTTTKSIANSVKSTNDFLNFVKTQLNDHDINTPAVLTAHLASLSSYGTKVNIRVADLLSTQTAIGNATYDIVEKTEELSKLKNGPTDLDVASQKLSLKQKENVLTDAKEKLDDYYIRAPFDGTIAKMDIKQAAFASSGTSLATIITHQNIAQVSLNEVDIAKIKVGQKATLTFDAVDGLNITGIVSEVDAIGTVSQGVVSYNVKIIFDTQDERIKSGMSVSAAVITTVKQDVLTVSNSAVKTREDISYVSTLTDIDSSQLLNSKGVTSSVSPKERQVEIGISNDSLTEIISGLNENDQVIVKTILPSTTATSAKTTSSPGLFGMPTGNNKNAGTSVRIQR